MSQSHEEKIWRSVQELEGQEDFSGKLDYEYPASDEELKEVHVNRRKFMQLMGASIAMTTAAGCIRKPVQKILPYSKRPEDLIPGNALHFATAYHVGKTVSGLLVESQEGRPTKVDGNPKHPLNQGKTDLWAQASVLGLYDQDRSKSPKKLGKTDKWNQFFQELHAQLEKAASQKGGGLALLVEEKPSPSFEASLRLLQSRYPKAQLFVHDPSASNVDAEALELLNIESSYVRYHYENAEVVLSLDSDFLGDEPTSLEATIGFNKKRDLFSQDLANAKMNRLYIAESRFTTTGMMADHRLRIKSSEVDSFLSCLVGYLLETKKVSLPAKASGLEASFQTIWASEQKSRAKDSLWNKWVREVSLDLLENKGKSLVVVGSKQPKQVHAVSYLLNALLENVGKTIQVYEAPQSFTKAGDLSDLVSAIRAKSVETLLILGGNPIYTAPGDLKFKEALESVDFSVHHGLYFDETAHQTKWHIPLSHYLEAWGDLRSLDGTISIQQPLVAPLYRTISELELVCHIAGADVTKGYDAVQTYWKAVKGNSFSPKLWRKWLHDGVVESATAKVKTIDGNTVKWEHLKSSIPTKPKTSKELEVLFVTDRTVLDGRFANNPWLQETPDPISKITWDNAAYVSPGFAKKNRLKDGEIIQLSNTTGSVLIPVFRIPGMEDSTIVLPLGYGRKVGGQVLTGAGFAVSALRSSTSPHFGLGVSLKKTNQPKYVLASTQSHGQVGMDDRSGFGALTEPITKRVRSGIARQADLAAFRKDPDLVQKAQDKVMPKKEIKSFLWDEPLDRFSQRKEGQAIGAGQQWGMTIDLNLCTGCNSCMLACQAENSIPVVGKDRILQGREMYWIRIDRYFTGENMDEPEAIVQPVGCAHCETAPCENVCPVSATVHSPDGMNDMAYNRCIGTRFCANNCPYKVRRFNFFNFSKENDASYPMLQMQRNPDVTVRFRGVMEKCSYCVQRISQAKIDAKVSGDGFVKDGDIVTACSQACPASAIVFGDVSDKNSQVSKRKQDKRNYEVLAELNIRPRTTYLAKARNRNPKLLS